VTADPCCVLCRHSTGVCLSRHSCEHHIEAQAQDDANHRATRTIRDPTGETAIRNITRERRSKK
jgi:hypothetical protein